VASFDLSWGAFKALMRPAIGNHEHLTTGNPSRLGRTVTRPLRQPATSRTLWLAAACQFSTALTAGAWHFATVDSSCFQANCAVQASWLIGDLAAHPTACSLFF